MTTSFDKPIWLCCTNCVKYILFVFSALIFSHVAHAGFRIEGVTGVSYSDLSTAASATTVTAVYGGIAGACSSPSSSSTCDSCNSTTTPAVACNPSSVNSALRIGFRIVVDEAVTAGVAYSVGTGTTASDGFSGGTMPELAIGQTLDLSTLLTWGHLCNVDANFDPSCDPTAASGTITNFAEPTLKIFLGIDTDNNTIIDADEIRSVIVSLNHIDTSAPSVQNYCTPTGDSSLNGICGYTIRPGDQKVKIDIFPSASTPTNNTGGPAWHGIGVFYKTLSNLADDANDVSNSSSPAIVRTFNSSFDLSNDIIDGLQNGTRYCFAMGNVNKAQNIFLFSLTGSAAADVCAVPSEVVGLLDDKSCFISTAAFGSNMATEVQIFRNFRDHFLLQSDLGRQFVKTYYKYSPPLANMISESEILKFIARLFLYPLYFFSLISLKWGFLESLFVLVVLVILISRFKKIIFSKRTNFIWIFLIFGFYSHDSSAQLRETKKTKHVGAAEGLTRIDKDGNYIYKQNVSNTRETSHFKIGGAGHPEITTDISSPDGSQIESVTFDDVYPNASALAFEYSYEYFMIKHGGKIGGHISAGFQVAQGKGRLVNDPTQESFETFTFLTMPINLGLVYRFEYTDRQILVPYVVGGGSVMVLAEKREDRSKVNAIGGFGFFAAGGGLLNLTAFDRDMASDLAAEYDIKNLWLSAEFKYLNVTNDAFIYDSGYVQAGFGFDF